MKTEVWVTINKRQRECEHKHTEQDILDLGDQGDKYEARLVIICLDCGSWKYGD
jgi:hypothetical protein